MSQSRRLNREKSPAEQLADSARALSPVRFFLRETNPDEDYGSFSSLGDASVNKSGETSYDYRQEDEFVRQQQANGSHGQSSILSGLEGNGVGRRKGGGGSAVNGNGAKKGRVSKGRDEDMPYRPAEDDWQVGSEDSGSDGEGIVRGGALDGRAATRGVRQEKGEGYLGMGLGLQPRRRTRRTGEAGDDGEGYDGLEHDYDNIAPSRSREVTPVPSHLDPSDRRYRSPTPVQLITRAFSPHVERHRDRDRVDRPKDRRQPPTWRTVVTNLLHGLALALQYIVEAGLAIAHTLLVRPFRAVFGSTKQFARAAKANWWKWLLGLLALSLLLRLSDAIGSGRKTGYAVPDVPPSSVEELVGRLSQLEKAVGMLSDSSRLLVEAEREGKKVDDDLVRRMTELEGSLEVERKRLVAEAESNASWKKQVKSASADKLQGSYDALKKEVDMLSGRVGQAEKHISGASGRFDAIDKDVSALRTRVDEVEQRFKAVMDDGRLRAALDRILPEYMPVRRAPDGGVQIDPTFWTEMRKVLVPRTDAESVVRSALAGVHTPSASTPAGKTDKELEDWADMIFAKKAREHDWASRREFTELLEGEVGRLKHIIEALPRTAPGSSKAPARNGASSSVTIKSTKGEDITSLLTDLIDAALLRYSKDTIARPDYALFTAGARVIPSITSDTFVLSMPGWWGRTVLGRKAVEGRSPATALHPDITVGNCWPFAGGQGQLGVLLNRRVRVEDVTVEHASADVALDTSTAPREVQVVSCRARRGGRGSGADISGALSSRRRTRQRFRSITSSTPRSEFHVAVAASNADLRKKARRRGSLGDDGVWTALTIAQRPAAPNASSSRRSRTTRPRRRISRRSRWIMRSLRWAWTWASSFSRWCRTGAGTLRVCTG